jgi:hypothetical protein
MLQHWTIFHRTTNYTHIKLLNLVITANDWLHVTHSRIQCPTFTANNFKL